MNIVSSSRFVHVLFISALQTMPVFVSFLVQISDNPKIEGHFLDEHRIVLLSETMSPN